MKISTIEDTYSEDFEDVLNWSKRTYDDMFSSFFEDMKELNKRLESNRRQITDDELENILTNIPLKLYSAAEKLNELKLRIEVIKLRIKKDKHASFANSDASSQVARKEEAALSVAEDEMLLKVYTSLIERVESEISFSKELLKTGFVEATDENLANYFKPFIESSLPINETSRVNDIYDSLDIIDELETNQSKFDYDEEEFIDWGLNLSISNSKTI